MRAREWYRGTTRNWKRKRKTGREGETQREWVSQSGEKERERERERERQEREESDWEMIDGAKKPISCFIWSALFCNQQTHTLQSTHTHSQYLSHRLLGCNQHTGYWSAAVNNKHCIHIDCTLTHTHTHTHTHTLCPEMSICKNEMLHTQAQSEGGHFQPVIMATLSPSFFFFYSCIGFGHRKHCRPSSKFSLLHTVILLILLYPQRINSSFHSPHQQEGQSTGSPTKWPPWSCGPSISCPRTPLSSWSEKQIADQWNQTLTPHFLSVNHIHSRVVPNN